MNMIYDPETWTVVTARSHGPRPYMSALRHMLYRGYTWASVIRHFRITDTQLQERIRAEFGT